MKSIGDLIPQQQPAVRQEASRVPAPIGKAPRDVAFSGAEPIPALPAVPPVLQRALASFTSPHEDVGFERSLVTPEVQDAAVVRLRLLEKRARPATEDDWTQFLLPLTNPDIFPNPILAEELEGRVGDIASAMGDIPACVLTVENQRTLCQRQWFPRPFDLKAVLLDDVFKVRKEVGALRGIVNVKVERREPEAPMTPESAIDLLASLDDALANGKDTRERLASRARVLRTTVKRAGLEMEPAFWSTLAEIAGPETTPLERKGSRPGGDNTLPPMPKVPIPQRPAGVLTPAEAKAMVARGERLPEVDLAALVAQKAALVDLGGTDAGD